MSEKKTDAVLQPLTLIDQAFSDRAEELGIKDLLMAFAASLASAKSAEALNVMPSERGYLITTLNQKTCTCEAVYSKDYEGKSNAPARPHDSSCAWSRFMKMFGTEDMKVKFAATRDRYRTWAKRVSKHPDNEAYKDVTKARAFLEAEAAEAAKES